MTAPGLRLLAACGAALVTAAACGGGAPAPSSQDVASAANTADRALELAEGLEQRLAEAESEVAAAAADRSQQARQVDRLSDRLERSLAKLRKSIARVEESASGAASSSLDALDRVSSAARELAVLTERFDYHLRNDGGR